MDKLIRDTIKDIGEEFRKDELAYLSLTGKIELAFRDRWAFLLHRRSGNFLISREWKNTDIAILDGDRPAALLELKAMYSFDAIHSDINKFYKYVKKDEKKALKLGKSVGSKPAVYTILLVTSPKGKVHDRYKTLVKWSSRINRREISFGHTKSAVEQKFGKNNLCSGYISAGKVFGIEVNIQYWVFKA